MYGQKVNGIYQEQFYVNKTIEENKYVDGKVSYKPYIAIVCDNGLVMPWTPSQEDILANDWIIIK